MALHAFHPDHIVVEADSGPTLRVDEPSRRALPPIYPTITLLLQLGAKDSVYLALAAGWSLSIWDSLISHNYTISLKCSMVLFTIVWLKLIFIYIFHKW